MLGKRRSFTRSVEETTYQCTHQCTTHKPKYSLIIPGLVIQASHVLSFLSLELRASTWCKWLIL